MHIVVCGNDASGKSTAVAGLSERLDLPAYFENWESNPFVGVAGRTYDSQVFFLHDAHDTEAKIVADGRRGIQDRTIHEHMSVFASYYHQVEELSDEEVRRLEVLYAILEADAVAPDIFIHLVAPVDVLYERLMARGREHELPLGREYLVRLDDLYREFVQSWRRSPVLTVNTAEVDLRNAADLDQLAAEIGSYGQ